MVKHNFKKYYFFDRTKIQDGDIQTLGLSNLAQNALMRNNIKTIYQLLTLLETNEFFDLPRLGGLRTWHYITDTICSICKNLALSNPTIQDFTTSELNTPIEQMSCYSQLKKLVITNNVKTFRDLIEFRDKNPWKYSVVNAVADVYLNKIKKRYATTNKLKQQRTEIQKKIDAHKTEINAHKTEITKLEQQMAALCNSKKSKIKEKKR